MGFRGGTPPPDVQTVQLAAGASVTVDGTAQVAGSVDVASLPPDTSHYWPCVSGEANPPTFSGTGSAYGAQAGNPAVITGTSLGSQVKWPALARYGPDGSIKPCVVTALVYLPSLAGATTSQSWFLGFGTAPANLNAVQLSRTISTGALSATLGGASVDLTALAGSWAWVELVWSAALTRATFQHDPTKRLTAGPAADAALSTFGYTAQAAGPAPIPQYLSNLFVSYPAQVPA